MEAMPSGAVFRGFAEAFFKAGEDGLERPVERAAAMNGAVGDAMDDVDFRLLPSIQRSRETRQLSAPRSMAIRAGSGICLGLFWFEFIAILPANERQQEIGERGIGLGISFELPILIFFLAIFGIVSPRFLWKNIRYAILIVFLVAGVICPMPDPLSMCIYATPMLALYLLGIGVAWWVHPDRKKAKEAKEPTA